jgi:hypothetical protein
MKNPASLYIIEQGKSRAVTNDECNDIASWANVIFGNLAAGAYRVLTAEAINRDAFPDSKYSLAGFPCPRCSTSVRRDRHINEFPETHLYACECTAVVIREPYDQLQQWHWSAFVGSRLVAERRYKQGDDLNESAIVIGPCNTQQSS